MTLKEQVSENGLLVTGLRAVSSLAHRLRDSFVARRLAAPGFRCGRSPHLNGLAHMRIGRGFTAGDALWLEAVTRFAGQSFSPRIVIGDNVGASDNVHIACTNSVVIGHGTLFGSRILVTDHSHGSYKGSAQSSPELRPNLRPLSADGSVTIGQNVWVGDGVAILAGAVIGDGAIIAANSVVNSAIPASTIAAGSPARPIRVWQEDRAAWAPFPTSIPAVEPLVS